MSVPAKYKNPSIYKKAKAKADEKYKKHSAYKSAYILKTYQDMGGVVDESKSKGGLKKWIKEEWKNLTPYAEGLTTNKNKFACGEKAKGQKGKSVCRSKAEAKQYSKKQIQKAVAIKNSGRRIDWTKL